MIKMILFNLFAFIAIDSFAQEIIIKARIEDCVSSKKPNNSIIYNVQNNSREDYYIDKSSLGFSLKIVDSKNNLIKPIASMGNMVMGYDRDTSECLKEYILINAGITKNFACYESLFKSYEFEVGREYSLLLKYKNASKKRRTKIKTYMQEVTIEPIKFKVCP